MPFISRIFGYTYMGKVSDERKKYVCSLQSCRAAVKLLTNYVLNP